MIEFVAGRGENKSTVDPEILKLSTIIEAGMQGPNYLDWGSDLAGYDARYYKHSDSKQRHVLLDGCYYIGEWSTETNRPHGRGIYINSCSWIEINYFKNEDCAGK